VVIRGVLVEYYVSERKIEGEKSGGGECVWSGFMLGVVLREVLIGGIGWEELFRK
jgi:hypothetical protein